MILNEIISLLKNAHHIAVMPHISVDGDGLGSSLALVLALEKMGKKATVFLEEDVPSTYRFLPGLEKVEVYTGGRKDVDVVVALDTGDLERLGKRAGVFNAAPQTVNIDHHKTNSMFASFNYVQTGAAAVGEVIYQMIKSMGIEIDAEIATCLYVALSTDTGGFRYSNTTAITHQIAGDLINNGADVADISQKVFETTSLERVKLLGASIEVLELLENGKVAMVVLTDEIMKSTRAQEEDCDGIVNIGRNIQGVEVSVMIRRKSNQEIKANLRSNTEVDVSQIALRFSGGGHKKAAGFTTSGEMEEVKENILNEIRKVL